MKRTLLLELLDQYQPTDKDEISSKLRMIQFIQNNKDCFNRSLEEGHITGSAWLVSQDKSSVLLMHHKKLDMWLQLGGHCDGNSDVLSVALKEAQEESGIHSIAPLSSSIFDIDVHPIPAHKQEPAHFHYDVRFLLQVTSEETITKNSESNELRWIPKKKDELPTSNPSVVRMFDKWVNS